MKNDGIIHLVPERSPVDPETISNLYDGTLANVPQLKTFSRAKICRQNCKIV
jgi:hypothetical protein